jgi:hypothetical protein
MAGTGRTEVPAAATAEDGVSAPGSRCAARLALQARARGCRTRSPGHAACNAFGVHCVQQGIQVQARQLSHHRALQ